MDTLCQIEVSMDTHIQNEMSRDIYLTLPMLRLLLPKAQGCKDF